MTRELTLAQRKLVGDEIAKEFRKWKRRKGELSARQRRQIIAIGFSKARAKDPRIPVANPDLGMAVLSGATAALVGKAIGNPALGRECNNPSHWNPTGIPFSGPRAYRPATRYGHRVVRGYTRLTSDMRRAAKAHETRRREYGKNPLLMTILGNPGRRRSNPYVVVDSRTGEVVGTHGEDFPRAARQAKNLAKLAGYPFDVEHTAQKSRARFTPKGGRFVMNPRKKVTMSLNKFVAMLKSKRDPKLWNEFVKKMNGYKKWTHGTSPKTVTLEAMDVPGVNGLWLTYDAGKEPEVLYRMPKGSKRKGAWRHPWESMPSVKHDPERGIIIKKLSGKARISDFYHG